MKKSYVLNIIIILVLSLMLFGQTQKANLIFSHKYHITELEISCADCHKAASSMESQDNLLPDHESCGACHEIDDNCKMCHKEDRDPSAVPRIQNYINKYPHGTHQGESFTCEKCHKDIEKSENIEDKHLPKMVLCVQCHDNKNQDEYCLFCHSKERTLIPTGHTKAFCEKNHGFASYMENLNCGACHTQGMCLDCHRKDNLDRKAHPLNYVNNHGMYAKGNKDNCYVCHEELSFCLDCHRQKMVMPRTHASANWSNRTNGGRHARSAKLDLDNCISCHSDVSGNPVCIQCHEYK